MYAAHTTVADHRETLHRRPQDVLLGVYESQLDHFTLDNFLLVINPGDGPKKVVTFCETAEFTFDAVLGAFDEVFFPM